MTAAPAGPVDHLAAGDGEAFWFAGGRITHKATGADHGGRLMVAEVVAPRGTGSPLHVHEYEDESWYLLKGELMFWLGDRVLTATAGSFVTGRRGTPHRFRVESAEATFLDLMTPAGFESFVRSTGWPASADGPPPEGLPTREGGEVDAAVRAAGLTLLAS